MQIDMHYYGVYAMARLAGLNADAAGTIATASQYVDDSTKNDTLDHQSGAKMIPIVSAHHTTSVKNVDRNDQRFIWIPFHFLPGNKGRAFTERLVCRRDSEPVRAMRDHHLGLSGVPFALELMGVTAHVYADTFSHFGFSGVSSRRNKVRSDKISIMDVSESTAAYWDKEKPRFFRKYGTQGGLLQNIKRTLFSSGAEFFSGALGHGAVLTFPDQPYLRWAFEYEENFDDRPDPVSTRSNQQYYLEACRVLYDMFQAFAQRRQDFGDPAGAVRFGDVEEKIREILALEEGKRGRSEAWRRAVRDGGLCAPEAIPAYPGADWDRDRDRFPGLEDIAEATTLPVYRFYQAASLHRHYVLRELLPEYKLVVV